MDNSPIGYFDGFPIFVSSRANKKYMAFVDGKMVHFGDSAYQHYHDIFGIYSSLDHWDKKRRDNYYSRHSKDVNNFGKAGRFSAGIL